VIESGTEPVVRVRDLRKRYGKQEALRGLQLDVQQGEIFGLIGPDGAGKSTVLKAVAGVLAHDSGSIDVLGVRLDSEAAAEAVKARIGFMPQGLGLHLYPELSVEENIDFFARLRSVPRPLLAERKQRLLSITRLDVFRARPMKLLSGGMKQKLGLICTLVHEPELIVLDEPTTGVDAVSRRDFWAILAELMSTGRMSALVSTAYLDEASRFDQVSLLWAGAELACGAPDELEASVPESPDEGAAPALERVFLALLGKQGIAAPPPPRLAAQSAVACCDTHAAAIEAVELTRDFRGFRAVDRASFRVTRGEIFGLLGANGAGKTTVIKMLTGLLEPSSGAGQVAGVDMRRAAIAIKRRIGYMSQAFSLYTDLTVAENLALYAGIYGLGGAEQRVRTRFVCELAELDAHLGQLTASLPMGVRQRLALGCALLHRPEVLFLDEPTSGVDPIGRQRFWQLLRGLAREDGVAILVTTHHMTEAEHCDRLALMFAGRIVADAPPAELKAAVEREAGRPLEIATERPDRALQRIRELGFADASLFGRHVRVLSREPSRDGARIERALLADGIRVHGLALRALSMEDVFVFRVTALERGAESRP
jgi:ABC-type multidrug transport system ATPase subunit